MGRISTVGRDDLSIEWLPSTPMARVTRSASEVALYRWFFFLNDGVPKPDIVGMPNLVSEDDILLCMLGPWDYSSGCNFDFCWSRFSGEVWWVRSLRKNRVNLYRRTPRVLGRAACIEGHSYRRDLIFSPILSIFFSRNFFSLSDPPVFCCQTCQIYLSWCFCSRRISQIVTGCLQTLIRYYGGT